MPPFIIACNVTHAHNDLPGWVPISKKQPGKNVGFSQTVPLLWIIVFRQTSEKIKDGKLTGAYTINPDEKNERNYYVINNQLRNRHDDS